MRAPVRFVVPYVLFVASFIVETASGVLAAFGVVPHQDVGEGLHPAGIASILVSLVLGVAALILLAWGKPARQAVAAVLFVVSVASWPITVLLLNTASTSGNIMLVVAFSHVLSAARFFLLLSAWIVAASHAPWMFAVALVATIVNTVLSAVVSFGVSGAAAALQASSGALAASVVVPALVKIVVFTGVVLVGRYMTAGAPNTDGGSGFSTSDRIGW